MSSHPRTSDALSEPVRSSRAPGPRCSVASRSKPRPRRAPVAAAGVGDAVDSLLPEDPRRGGLRREPLEVAAGALRSPRRAREPGRQPVRAPGARWFHRRLERDPHRALRTNSTPAILLYPECNYLSWAGAVDYRKTFKNLKVYFVPGAGHYIQFEQPELLRRVILSFLLDQSDVLPAYDRDDDPRVRSTQSPASKPGTGSGSGQSR